MKTFQIINRACDRFHVDEMGYVNESAFESHVVRCLSYVYPDYKAVVFAGYFIFNGEARKADLALVANDFSHWFVLEVELLTHSLEYHVLPQVRTIKYGNLPLDTANPLARSLGLPEKQVRTLIDRVPRGVAVIANNYSKEWDYALKGIDVQYIAIVPYTSPDGVIAYEMLGQLNINQRSLGFGLYNAVDAVIRIRREVELDDGCYQIEGPDGVLAEWTVKRSDQFAWLIKRGAKLLCNHESFVQVIRRQNGKIILRI